MTLHNVDIAGREGNWHIQINKGRITSITSHGKMPDTGDSIDLKGSTCLPGLINSHDHLDFNLFPQLKDKIYSNYSEWGPAIQKNHKDKIDRVLRIPAALRIKWGVYKNLLNGFTTVVNHGKKLKIESDLVDIFQDYYPLHSPGFENNWKWKLNNPFKTGKPFVMHLGEGTDTAAKEEIDSVIQSNFFRKEIIAIHAVAMRPEQAGFFKGLVCCPASNYFLLDQTADINALKEKLIIVFGTDSTLTANWNAWEHFHLALQKQILSSEELLMMLGPAAASLWKLKDRGELRVGLKADILVLRKKDELFSAGPGDILLLIKNAEVKMIDEEIQAQGISLMKPFSRIILGNSVKLVQGDLAGLTRDILDIYSEAEIPFKLVDE